MKTNILLAGVGGQGVLSIAAVIAKAAEKAGFSIRQSEVHGMAQRGGSVLAHLRIGGAGEKIAGDLIPQGAAHLIIAMEPLESLRYAAYLAPDGVLISASESFVNIPDYPELEIILETVKSFPRSRLVPASRLAKEAGQPKAANIVMAGASSDFLPVSSELLEESIAELFGAKDILSLESNKKAFLLGKGKE
jgi:indolepyruvate ferredoxin oxidoreductase beta subunit